MSIEQMNVATERLRALLEALEGLTPEERATVLAAYADMTPRRRSELALRALGPKNPLTRQALAALTLEQRATVLDNHTPVPVLGNTRKPYVDMTPSERAELALRDRPAFDRMRAEWLQAAGRTRAHAPGQ